MPRGQRPLAKIFVKQTPPRLLTKRIHPKDGKGPRLWNAKRRIKSSKGLSASSAAILVDKDKLWQGVSIDLEWMPYLENKKVDFEWWKLDSEKLPRFLEAHPMLRELSPDVKEFIQKGSINLDGSKILRILRNPARYFSVPHHVPLSMRKQVYL